MHIYSRVYIADFRLLDPGCVYLFIVGKEKRPSLLLKGRYITCFNNALYLITV